jgi:hypothetical protein
MPSETKPSTDQVLTKTLHRLRLLRALRVALGDVDALDAELRASACAQPSRSRSRLGEVGRPSVGGEVDQRLLDEPGHHAGIGAAAGDGGGAAGIRAFSVAHGLAQRVVGALGRIRRAWSK